MKNSFNFCFEPSLAVNRPNLAGGGGQNIIFLYEAIKNLDARRNYEKASNFIFAAFAIYNNS